VLIYSGDGVRVLQHEHLTLFHVQKWMDGDDRRGYGRCFDWRTVLETRSIEEVNNYVFGKST
jgi:hypothetical protein